MTPREKLKKTDPAWWRSLPPATKLAVGVMTSLAAVFGAGAATAMKGQVYIGAPGRLERLEVSDSIQNAWIRDHDRDFEATNARSEANRALMLRTDTTVAAMRDDVREVRELVEDLSCHVRGLSIPQCMAEKRGRAP